MLLDVESNAVSSVDVTESLPLELTAGAAFFLGLAIFLVKQNAKYIPSWDPASFLRFIAFPVDESLQLAIS